MAAAFPDPRVLGPGDPVRVYEVGPRDGLQAEQTVVPTAAKIELVHRLAAAGLDTVEVTSFVSPRWVPQLADAAEVMAGVAELADRIRMPVLVPNLRGLERARAAGATEVAVFVSATEAFAQANLATTVQAALDRAIEVTRVAGDAGLVVRGYVSMCFGDPWEGTVRPEQVAPVAAELHTAGCATISLGDTIGVGTAGQVGAVVRACASEGVPLSALALHFHDTYGQALANVIAGLTAGVREFDASAGGLGGCPYAKSATGNLATEDLVWLLEGLGVSTGVDLTALAETSTWIAGLLGRPAPSRVVRALAG